MVFGGVNPDVSTDEELAKENTAEDRHEVSDVEGHDRQHAKETRNISIASFLMPTIAQIQCGKEQKLQVQPTAGILIRRSMLPSKL